MPRPKELWLSVGISGWVVQWASGSRYRGRLAKIRRRTQVVLAFRDFWAARGGQQQAGPHALGRAAAGAVPLPGSTPGPQSEPRSAISHVSGNLAG